MTAQLLDEGWTLTVKGENVFHVDEPVDTTVPSTVYSTLLAAAHGFRTLTLTVRIRWMYI